MMIPQLPPELCAALIDRLALDAWKLSLHKDRQALYEALNTVCVGDLVVEITSRHHESPIERVGRIDSMTQDKLRGEIVTLTTLDGRSLNWSNAQFIRVIE